jgi:hypothetical protein
MILIHICIMCHIHHVLCGMISLKTGKFNFLYNDADGSHCPKEVAPDEGPGIHFKAGYLNQSFYKHYILLVCDV